MPLRNSVKVVDIGWFKLSKDCLLHTVLGLVPVLSQIKYSVSSFVYSDCSRSADAEAYKPMMIKVVLQKNIKRTLTRAVVGMNVLPW